MILMFRISLDIYIETIIINKSTSNNKNVVLGLNHAFIKHEGILLTKPWPDTGHYLWCGRAT